MHSMSFHFGVEETILFDGWVTSNWQGIVGSVVGITLLAAIYEGLKNYRDYLFVNASALHQGNGKCPPKQPSMSSGIHLFQTILHMIQIIVGYFLMLIFMTYNVWLCIAVTVGGGFGYWLFAWRKASSDITDCCN
ncbi:high affinity copper uptake protein 1 [Neodiprion pinetum]|uniref:Copper transport protein n=1 Tax=Neodiprion lecontei TaxID=441921 RepID=A0A6J0CAE1_NEOLC|nr:high affinity copper uptake protein 1 [Neodiprion lecontei]XP_046429758.1 high affinity copper uptake protein 1-like [Neodiprion fabricii]XP_046486437.1 high affinity copper uptake protein 1-like [Neodiprion pinetum]XP_046623517.1 high affinity copper uptake protein 1-like [Neodiprion virginianus]